MASIPFDRFLDDLAEHGHDMPEQAVRQDLTGIWRSLAPETKEALLSDLDLPDMELDELEPHLEGAEVIFDLPFDEEEVEDPALAAAESMQPLADHQAPDAMDGDEEAAAEELDEDDLPEVEALDELTDGLDPADAEALAEIEAGEGGPPPEDLDDIEPLEDLESLEDIEPPEDLDPAEAAALAELEPDADPDAEAEADAGEPQVIEPLVDIDVDSLSRPDDGADAVTAEALDPAELAELEDAEAEEDETGFEDLAGALGEEASEEHLEEIEVYPVYEPYAYVRITYDPDNHQYLYHVIEPDLSEREERILQFIEETIVDVLDVGLSQLTEEDAEAMVQELTDQVIQDYSIELDENARMRLSYYTIRDFTGFGKLDVLMRDPMIEDISCDGSAIPIFLYHRKYESMASTVIFEQDPELDSFVIKMAQRSGKHISIADPLLDARLPDGSRLNATLSREVTAKGSTFTIRKFRDEPFTPPDLVRFGTQSPEMLAFFWMAVQHGASLIMAGGTASGKTTALNAMMLFIPPQMKIVSIEDTRELNLPHPNWIPGTIRSGFGSRDDSGRRAGEIDMFELLKAALRQRPEYIAVGEVRGEEATVLFQAMATGHAAYGTMHADSVTSVIHRLEGEPINIPRPLLEALDVVCIQIQTRIGGKRVRRTKEVVEIVGLDPNTKELLTNEVFHWDPSTDDFDASGISYVLERIQKENNMAKPELQREMEQRTVIIRWMLENNVRDYHDVAKVVQAYYNEPEETMRRVREDLEDDMGQASTSFGESIGAAGDFDDDPFDALADDEPGGVPEEDVYDPPEPAGRTDPEEASLEAIEPEPLDDLGIEEADLEAVEPADAEPLDKADLAELSADPDDAAGISSGPPVGEASGIELDDLVGEALSTEDEDEEDEEASA